MSTDGRLQRDAEQDPQRGHDLPVTGDESAEGAGPTARSSADRLLARLADSSGALRRLTDVASGLLSGAQDRVAIQVSLLSDVQVVAAGTGLPPGSVGSTGPLEDSLCAVTAASGGTLDVPDAAADARVAGLPPVTSGAVAAYLGVPLVSMDGSTVGALCAFTPQPRSWSHQDEALLQALAAAVVAQLELAALGREFDASRTRSEIALEAAGIGSFDLDLSTGALDWDVRMQELFGYGPGEFTQDVAGAMDRVHPADRDHVTAGMDEALAQVGAYNSEFRCVLPDGTERWLAARGRALAGEDGAAARLVGTASDTTELRTARDRAARLLDTMRTGFLAMDRGWTVTYLNAEAARVTGYSPEQLVGRDVWEAFPGLDATEFGAQYRRAMETGESVELEAYYDHLEGWFEVRAVPTEDGLSLFFLEVTDRHRDRESAQAAAARLELLASVSNELADVGLDVDGALARLAQLLVPSLADWAMITFVEDDALRDVAGWHADPALQPLVEQYVEHRLVGRTDSGAVEQARRIRRPVAIPSGVTEQILPVLGSDLAREALAVLLPDSVVVVPFVVRGEVTGVLSLVRDVGRGPATEQEVATAAEIASRAGLVLENARLHAQQAGLAEGLQRSLLTTPPEPDHCQIAVRYVAAVRAAEVGGDWYDAFLQRDGATVLVIGDVMGHDTEAAAAMGQLRGITRGIAWGTGGGPAQVLADLDEGMAGLQVRTTATALIARLEQGEADRENGLRTLRWSNAGHPPPLLLLADGTVEVLNAEPDLLLGLDAAFPRGEHARCLPPDSTLLLYTDGLVERRGQDLDAGLELLGRRLAALASEPLERLCDRLLQQMLPDGAEDDAALVAVRLFDEARPRPSEAGPERLPETHS